MLPKHWKSSFLEKVFQILISVSPQISESRKFPMMSDLSSKHTLSSCFLAVVGNFVVKPDSCMYGGMFPRIHLGYLG